VLGGYRIQGNDSDTSHELLKQAKLLEENGAQALVLECIPKDLAKIITNELNIPIIGIGAGIDCDGQVLVYHDRSEEDTSELQSRFDLVCRLLLEKNKIKLCV